MTHISGSPEQFVEEAMAGYCDLHGDRVRAVPGGVLRSTVTPRGKVAVVVGGGSGHYPAFAGYVGPGFADAAVCGDIFASPSTRYIHDVALAAERGAGVLLCYGNYAGDVLNFGFAAERLRGAGIDTRLLASCDDVASAGPKDRARRRGIAGDLPIFKIAAAAAEQGLSLDEVERAGQLANARTASFGVAFGGCTLPGASAPLFTVGAGQMALGLGLHGEPGLSEQPLASAAELAMILVDRLLQERPAGAGDRVAVILNGLGATKQEELFVLWGYIAPRLRSAGLKLIAPLVGEYATSLEMAGCSLTLTWLDEALEAWWLAPVDAPGFRRGDVGEQRVDETPAITAVSSSASTWPAADAASQAAGGQLAQSLQQMAQVLAEAEDELGRIDARAGDGDHGQGMSRGSAAAAQAATEAAAAGAGIASVLATAAHAWADRAGGTSGAIWGVLLLHWSQALEDASAPDRQRVREGADAACEAVMRLGGAQLGDKTLVDALVPFAATLGRRIDAGDDLGTAWQQAAEAAGRAAEATRELTPRLGRARNHEQRSLGHPDAGAVSLALCARTLASHFSLAESSHD